MINAQFRSNSNPRGFTLIEVLLALSIMAVMAVLAWRGIDGMARAQQQARQHTDEVLALQAGLAQWRADLDAMVSWSAPNTNQPLPRTLIWDGSTLRITRADAADPGAGVRVVAWTRRATGAWMRWQSPPLRSQQAWASAWDQAHQWSQGATPQADTQAITIASAGQWQLHYFRNDAWTNPLSSDAAGGGSGGTGGNSQAQLPDGVRLMIELAPGQAISGPITLDWMRPTAGGPR